MRLSIGAFAKTPPVPKMPPGLVELMEGLSKEVLRNNPPSEDLYHFCADHMKNLLNLRGASEGKKPLPLDQKIKRAQEKVNRTSEKRRKKFETFLKQSNIENTEECISSVSKQNAEPNTEEVSEKAFELTSNDNDFQETLHSSVVNKDQVVNIIEAGDEVKKEDILNEKEIVNSLSNQNAEPNIEEVSKKTNELISNLDDFQETLNVENTTEAGDEVKKEDVLNEKEIVTESKESSVHEDIAGEEHVAAMNHTNELMFREMHQEMENSTMNFNETIDNVEQNNRDDMNDLIHIGKRLRNTSESTVVPQTKDNNLNLNVTSGHETKNVKQNDHDSIEDDDVHIIHNAALEETIVVVNNTLDEFDNDINLVNTNDNGEHYAVTPEIIVNSIDEDAQKEKLSEENDTENSFKEPLLNADLLEVETSNDIKTVTINESCEVSPTVLKIEDNVVNVIEIKKTEDLQSNDSLIHKNLGDSLNNVKFGGEKDINTIIAENPTANVTNDAIASAVEIEVLHKKPDLLDEDNLKNNEISIITKADSNEQETSLVSLQNYGQDSQKSLSVDEKNDSAMTNTIINAIAKSDSMNEESHDNVSDNTVNEIAESSEVTNSGMDLETAAVTIQKVFRSFMFKSRASTLDEGTNDNVSLDLNYPTEDMLLNEAEGVNLKTNDEYYASNLKERRPLGITRMDTILQTVNEEKSLSLSDDSSMSSAATIIQAHVRGFLVRNKLHSTKTTSSNSLANSDEIDNEPKNKTVLNIHIIPEGGHYLSRDESMAMSLDLPYDHSPPTGWGHSASLNLHPLSERRKQLKREDAIQSISPPSNNSGKLSDDIESVKDMSVNGTDVGSNAPLLTNSDAVLLPNEIKTDKSLEQEDGLNNIDNQPTLIVPTKSLSVEDNGNKSSHIGDLQPSVEYEENYLESTTDNLKNIENQPNTIARTKIITAEADLVIQDNGNKLSQKDNFHSSVDNEENYLESTTNKSITEMVVAEVIPNKDNCPDDEDSSMNTEIEPTDHETTSESVTGETVVEVKSHLDEIVNTDSLVEKNSLTNMQSDEMDVVTKDEISDKSFAPSMDFDSTTKLLHSGEFHDVLPTSVSRVNSSVVREFKNVMVKYLLWNHSS